MEEEVQEVIDFLTGRSSFGWATSLELRKDIKGRLIDERPHVLGPMTLTQAIKITKFDCSRVRRAFAACFRSW